MSPIERSAGGGGGGGFANPMTTAGDIIIENAVPAAARLGVGAAGQVLGVSAGLPAWVYPPGYELNYTEITAPINVTSTTEATGTLILSPGAVTFDGAPVMCEVFCIVVSPNGVACTIRLNLFEGATEITELGVSFVGSSSGNNQLFQTFHAVYRFTPSAASHTYTVTAFVNTTVGTPRVEAGAGGTAGESPAFIRFTKV